MSGRQQKQYSRKSYRTKYTEKKKDLKSMTISVHLRELETEERFNSKSSRKKERKLEQK